MSISVRLLIQNILKPKIRNQLYTFIQKWFLTKFSHFPTQHYHKLLARALCLFLIQVAEPNVAEKEPDGVEPVPSLSKGRHSTTVPQFMFSGPAQFGVLRPSDVAKFDWSKI